MQTYLQCEVGWFILIGSKKINEVVGSLAWYYLVWKGKEAKEIISEYTSICTGGYFGMTAVVCSKAECALLRWFINGLINVNTLLTKEVLKYIMGEVMICRGGSGSGSGGKKELVTEIFNTTDYNWVVPEAVDNQFLVTCVGGGGGVADTHTGGGSGWSNSEYLYLESNQIIEISVGVGGGTYSGAGGTTSFGTYISATGGGYGNSSFAGCGGAGGGGRSGADGGDGYLWGGGGYLSVSVTGYGGNAGPYGGGGGSDANSAGSGGIYGGGGGGGGFGHGGTGGMYGGGGGGGYYGGTGGTYGGNGGGYRNSSSHTNPKNGTNTIGWTNVLNGYMNEDLRGAGKIANYIFNTYCCGGGGYGGNGGGGNSEGGGGGGYGGNGGNEGGGGGGFGGDGGNYGGGGGGYGKNAKGGDNGGGGGGYYTPANGYGGGGWFGWGNGANGNSGNGGNGVCIVKYYVWA